MIFMHYIKLIPMRFCTKNKLNMTARVNYAFWLAENIKCSLQDIVHVTCCVLFCYYQKFKMVTITGQTFSILELHGKIFFSFETRYLIERKWSLQKILFLMLIGIQYGCNQGTSLTYDWPHGQYIFQIIIFWNH